MGHERIMSCQGNAHGVKVWKDKILPKKESTREGGYCMDCDLFGLLLVIQMK